MRFRYVVTLLAVFVLGVGSVPVAAAVLDALDCNGCVDTADLHRSAVTSTKIKDGAVHNADLGSKAVTRPKIKNRAVTHAKLATGVVMGAKVNGSNGALLSGTTGVSSTRTGNGGYEVTFPVDIGDCIATATSTAPFAEVALFPIVIDLVPEFPSPNVISILSWNAASGMVADGDVSVMVTCP
jgi:hypothetical protein